MNARTSSDKLVDFSCILFSNITARESANWTMIISIRSLCRPYRFSWYEIPRIAHMFADKNVISISVTTFSFIYIFDASRYAHRICIFLYILVHLYIRYGKREEKKIETVYNAFVHPCAIASIMHREAMALCTRDGDIKRTRPGQWFVTWTNVRRSRRAFFFPELNASSRLTEDNESVETRARIGVEGDLT